MKQVVYLVDDDEDDHYLVQQSLKPHANCEIHSFYHGQELINFLNSQPDRHPTLILLDLNMPRMDGFETLTVLKASTLWSNIPVVILTTSSHESDRAKCYALGSDGFLTKPADYRSLSEILSSVSNCWD